MLNSTATGGIIVTSRINHTAFGLALPAATNQTVKPEMYTPGTSPEPHVLGMNLAT